MNLLKQWWNITKDVLFEPTKYFSKMPTKGGFEDPVKFALISFTITGLSLALIYTIISMAMPQLMLIGLALAVIIPVFGTIGIFLGAAFNHLSAKIVGGKGTYEGSFRVTSSITPISIISWIPLVSLFVSVYGFILTLIGLSHVHKISKWRVFGGVVLVSLILFTVLFGLILLVSNGAYY